MLERYYEVGGWEMDYRSSRWKKLSELDPDDNIGELSKIRIYMKWS